MHMHVLLVILEPAFDVVSHVVCVCVCVSVSLCIFYAFIANVHFFIFLQDIDVMRTRELLFFL